MAKSAKNAGGGASGISIVLDEESNPKVRTATIVNRIHAAKNLDEFFLEIKDDIHGLFDAERATLYAVDREKRELFSRFLLDPIEGIKEIRVPITEDSVSGYCARYGKVLNIVDAYDAGELTAIGPRLHFDRVWDERSGFRTRQKTVGGRKVNKRQRARHGSF